MPKLRRPLLLPAISVCLALGPAAPARAATDVYTCEAQGLTVTTTPDDSADQGLESAVTDANQTEGPEGVLLDGDNGAGRSGLMSFDSGAPTRETSYVCVFADGDLNDGNGQSGAYLVRIASVGSYRSVVCGTGSVEGSTEIRFYDLLTLQDVTSTKANGPVRFGYEGSLVAGQSVLDVTGGSTARSSDVSGAGVLSLVPQSWQDNAGNKGAGATVPDLTPVSAPCVDGDVGAWLGAVSFAVTATY